MRYWLMKSEPEVFSIDHLKRLQTSIWDGVRNYQARNFMMNDMKVGDQILFYHSNANPPGVAGLAEVSRLAEPDPSQFNKKSEYFEPRASKEKPVWFAVEVRFNEKFDTLVSLNDLRENKKLEGMLVVRPGQRLSIQPVDPGQFEEVLKMVKR